MKTLINSVNFKYFALLGVASILLIAILAGCASQNPAAPSNALPTSAEAASTGTSASGAAVIYGQVQDVDTNLAISDTDASITVYLYLDSKLITSQAIRNSTFTFNNVAGGLYTIFAQDSSGRFSPNYQLVDASGGSSTRIDLKLKRLITAPTVSRLTFFGKLVSSPNKEPVSFAKVSLGASGGIGSSSYETVTLIDGTFFLFNISSGTYDVTFSKSGFSNRIVTLTVSNSDVSFGNAVVNLGVTSTRSDGIAKVWSGYDLGETEISPDYSVTGAIEGYVKDIDNNPVPNFTFKLLYRKDAVETSAITNSVLAVKTNAAGYFSVVALQIGFYYAVKQDAQPYPILDNTGNIVGWGIAGTVYNSGVSVSAGKTAEMYIIKQDDIAGVDAPTLIGPTSTGGGYNNVASYSLKDDVVFSWVGVGTATQYVVDISNITSRNSGNSTPITFNYVANAGATFTASVNLAKAKLGIGYYLWKVGAIDSANNQTVYSANTFEFIIRPSKDEIAPYDGVGIEAGGASPSVTFTWPTDPTSSHVIIEVYNDLNTPPTLYGFDRGGSPKIDTNGSVNGSEYRVWWDNWASWPRGWRWRWHIKYFYGSSNIVIQSEDSVFTFR